MKMPLDPAIIYTSPKGRTFRVSGIEKIPETSKWIGRVEKHHWIVTIRFLDDNNFGRLYFDHNDIHYKTTL
jgi:hypothetical protein